jgi:S-formylglutathione hydrolase FrmB
MKKVFLILFFIGIMAVLLSGCTKRSNPTSSTYPAGRVYEQPETLSIALYGNLLEDPFKRSLAVYLPPDYKHFGLRAGYPVLFLLHEFKGDIFTFRDKYQIARIADWLIGTKQIQPMVIVMPDISNSLNGSFCGNDSLLGNYEQYIQDIRSWADSNFNIYLKRVGALGFWDADYPKYRGIAGVGMGGYGAFRMAFLDAEKDSNHFGVIGALNAPLGFIGDTTASVSVPFNGGILSWAEMFLDSNNVDTSGQGYYLINPRNPSNDNLTKMFFAMAAAFSERNSSHSGDPTFFELIPGSWGLALPFDSLGNKDTVVWNDWRANDITTRVLGGTVSQTALMKYNNKIYFDCGDANILNLQYQNRIFDKALSSKGVGHTYYEYFGYTGYPAADVNFTADRLVELLKYFSAKFPPPPQ